MGEGDGYDRWVEVKNRYVVGGGICCQCGWACCAVLDNCLLFFSLCSSGFQELLKLKPPSRIIPPS
jgi:hypothetical protein